MSYVVNVEVLLHREGRWLLIERGGPEAHAAGTLAGVGGKVEGHGAVDEILEETGRREVAEEIGVELGPSDLRYVRSSLFTSDRGGAVVNVVFVAELPAGARPTVVSSSEVAAIHWLSEPEAISHPKSPPWTAKSVRRAAAMFGRD